MRNIKQELNFIFPLDLRERVSNYLVEKPFVSLSLAEYG